MKAEQHQINTATWHIQLLGAFTAQLGDHEVVRFRTHKTGALLAYLAFHLRRAHSRDDLIELLWPERDADRADHALRQAVWSLRRQLEPPGTARGSVVCGAAEALQLNRQIVSTDVGAFVAALNASREAAEPSEAVRRLGRALALYRGDLLPGYYDDWAVHERERLSDMYAYGLQRAVRLLEQVEGPERALVFARKAVATAPDQKEPHAHTLRLLTALGRAEEACAHYDRLPPTLQRSLGSMAAPARATGVCASVVKTAAPGALVIPAGRVSRREPHKLVEAPAGASTEPARRGRPRRGLFTHSAAAQTRSGLPARLTRFFGRQRELASLQEILARPELGSPSRLSRSKRAARLVTLVGAAGVGKTRLAEEVAHALSEAYDGRVSLVRLAQLNEGRLVDEALAHVLCVANEPATTLRARLHAAIGERPTLIVLDNVDRLVEHVSDLVSELLARHPKLAVLATSRQPLGVAGEQQWALVPLATPLAPGTPERLLEFPAVEMFLDRARLVCPDFQVTDRNAAAVAEVCRRLDGIPLAIELAAAHSQALTPARMLRQLDDRFEFLVGRGRSNEAHHRTLKEAIAWSCELLAPDERAFFAQLSIFRSGWTLDAAEQVCRQRRALRYIEQLLDRRLITAEQQGDEMRYSMLESLREYAAESLSATVRIELEERHRQYFLELAEEAEPCLRSRDAPAWLTRLDPECGNIRLAMAGGDAVTRLRLAGAVWRFWMLRSHISEGAEYLEQTLQETADAPAKYRSRAIVGLGVLRMRQGRLEEAEHYLADGSALCRSQRDWGGLALALGALGPTAAARGDHAAAERYLHESLRLREQAGDTWAAAAALNNLGGQAREQGDFRAAAEYYRRSIRYYEQAGDWRNACTVRSNRANALIDEGRFEEARLCLEENLARLRTTGDRWSIAHLLHNLGYALRRASELLPARRALEEALIIRRELGDAQGVGYTLVELGNLAHCEADDRMAAMLLASAEMVLRECGAQLTRPDEWRQDVEVIRRSLTATEFEALWSYGTELSVASAIACALRQPDPALAPDPAPLTLLDRSAEGELMVSTYN